MSRPLRADESLRPPINPEHEGLLNEVDEFGINLTLWEIEFIESLMTQVSEGCHPFSDIQVEKLRQIHSQRVDGSNE